MSRTVMGRFGASYFGCAVGIQPGVDPHFGELRRVDRERRVELELAALVQLHERHAGHRLGHGENLHDGVARHRLVVFAIGETEGAEVHLLAALIHQRRNADDLLAVDEALERGCRWRPDRRAAVAAERARRPAQAPARASRLPRSRSGRRTSTPSVPQQAIKTFIDPLLVSAWSSRRAASTAPRRRSTDSGRWPSPRTARSQCRSCRTSAARATRRSQIVAATGVGRRGPSGHVNELAPVEPELHFIRSDLHMPFDAGPTPHRQRATSNAACSPWSPAAWFRSWP